MSNFMLDGPQIVALTKLVVAAFDRPSLRTELLGRLNLDLDPIVNSPHFDRDVEFLILKQNREGVIPRFIKAVKDARPHRLDLQKFGPSFNVEVGAGFPAGKNLEAVLALGIMYQPAGIWAGKLNDALRRVCRVERDGRSRGTGFLVGPQVVLTCFHVVQACLESEKTIPRDPPNGMQVRFDYQLTESGPSTGTPRRLSSSDWLVDFLPPSPVDEQADPKPRAPGTDELDFALLRLEEPEGERRSWLEPVEHELKPGDPMLMLHHPEQNPMQLSFDTKAVTEVADIGPRVRYRTSTDGGSSGSPCFTADWKLVALHQGREAMRHEPRYNQGIPFSSMVPVLRERLRHEPAKRSLLPWIDATPKQRVFEASTPDPIGMKLIRIEPGAFLMGTTIDQLDQFMRLFPASKREWIDDEQPQHPVRITRPFFLGIHEVTVGQFRRFVEKNGYRTEAEKDGKGCFVWYESKKTWVRDPSKNWRDPGFPQSDDHPVVCVSHNDAMAFCQWLSEEERRTYRLPTEAEWEFACRAGTTTLYSNGDDPEGLVSVANVADATLKKKFPDFTCTEADDGYPYTAPVGSFPPNPWGLYDMIGNVWEWCADWYDDKYYASSPATDPPGALESSSRVFRGGSWYSSPCLCRPALRSRFMPESRYGNLGFRVAAVQE